MGAASSCSAASPVAESRRSLASGARSPKSPPSREAPPAQRRSARLYEPIERLLALGFETDSARAALAAAGGDVERAIRLALEDSEAHDARSLGEWEFEGDKGWVPFDCAADAAIREAVGKGEIACELRVAGHRYLVDFVSMTQMNLVTQRTRSIRRRPT